LGDSLYFKLHASI